MRSWPPVRPSPTTAVYYSSACLLRHHRPRCRIRSSGLQKHRELLLLRSVFSAVGGVRRRWLGARDGVARELRVAPASWLSRAATCRTGAQHVDQTAQMRNASQIWEDSLAIPPSDREQLAVAADRDARFTGRRRRFDMDPRQSRLLRTLSAAVTSSAITLPTRVNGKAVRTYQVRDPIFAEKVIRRDCVGESGFRVHGQRHNYVPAVRR